MNLLKTLKEAREALERSKPISCVYAIDSDAIGEHEKAITNLTAAIEQVEKAEPVAEVAAGNRGDRLMWAYEDSQGSVPVGTKLFTFPPDAQAEIERLHQVCRNAYEVWAGSEGIPQPETAPEAYLLQLLEQMRDEVKKGLK